MSCRTDLGGARRLSESVRGLRGSRENTSRVRQPKYRGSDTDRLRGKGSRRLAATSDDNGRRSSSSSRSATRQREKGTSGNESHQDEGPSAGSRLADRRPRGQTECDHGAMVRLAFDADGAAMPLNDSIGCAETETCALEPFGRGEG